MKCRFIIEGKYLKSLNDELSGGARINYIFNEIFKKSIQGLDPFEFVNDQVSFLTKKNNFS